jgi:hypothetical protein
MILRLRAATKFQWKLSTKLQIEICAALLHLNSIVPALYYQNIKRHCSISALHLGGFDF